jgi:hypothetical protein
MFQLRTNNDVELEFSDLPPITGDEALLWKEAPARQIVLTSLLGAGIGVLGAFSLFPVDPALLFGGVLGAYGGFLAAAMRAGGAPNDVDG